MRNPSPAARGRGPFDLTIVAPAGPGYRGLRLGDPGFAIVARIGPSSPTVADLERFSADVARAAPKLGGRLVRAILLRVEPGPLPDPVYAYAVDHPIEIAGGRVALELVSEQPNGRYDLVPHVVGVP